MKVHSAFCSQVAQYFLFTSICKSMQEFKYPDKCSWEKKKKIHSKEKNIMVSISALREV